MQQVEQLNSWNIEQNPYDNYADVRAQMERKPKTQAMPNWYLNQQQPQTNTYTQPAVQNTQDDEYEEVIESIYSSPTRTAVLSEAMQRIEQAKLYELLVNHELLAPGSASPEIQKKVQDEIRAFVIERLETLLGIRKEQQKQSSLDLTQEEVRVLKMLAAKVIGKDTPKSEPQITPLAANPNQPKVNPVAAPQIQRPAQVTQPVQQQTRMVKKKKPMGQQPQQKPEPIPQDLTPERAAEIAAKRGPRKQAASVPQSKPMPNPQMMDQIVAQKTLGQTGMVKSVGGDSVNSNLLQQLIGKSIQQNANIREE